ncbi:MAG: hypothetical protein WD206_09845 [Actinomycetota bacterium]
MRASDDASRRVRGEAPARALSPRQRLVALANEFCFETRKLFGMWGKVDVTVVGVSLDALAATVRTRRRDDPAPLVENVRNGLANHLEDLIPCPRAHLYYSNPDLGIELREFDLPFFDPRRSEPLPSSVMLFEDLVAAERDGYRGAARRAWTALLAERQRDGVSRRRA